MIGGRESGYQPSEEEVALAESHMTKQEASASRDREHFDQYVEDMWNPDTKKDVEFPDRYREAEKSGEKFVEIPVMVTIKVPAGDIITDPGHQIRNSIFYATKGLEKAMLEQLSEQQPELVADAKEYERIHQELWEMFITSKEDKDLYPDNADNRSITFDEERFKASAKRLREIADKYGFDASRSMDLLNQVHRNE